MNVNIIIILIVCGIIFLGLAGYLFYFENSNISHDDWGISISYIYYHTKMNKVFCVICWVLLRIFSFLMTIAIIVLGIPFLICKFFYWLSHIGRK